MNATASMPVVYYSVAGSKEVYWRQWMRSVTSLRLHNSAVPIHLIHYDALPNNVRFHAEKFGVELHDMGDYWTNFVGHQHASLLFQHLTLHKFSALHVLPRSDQTMFLDCDTYFFGDVEEVVGAYRTADFYAREEVMTKANHFGPNPGWIDEGRLSLLAEREGCAFVPPLNTGVFLMNVRAREALSRSYQVFLDFAARLLLRQIENPSSSEWIIEEIAMWLTLGKLGLSVGLMTRECVIQGSECNQQFDDAPRPIVAHYWSNGEGAFLNKLRELEAGDS